MKFLKKLFGRCKPDKTEYIKAMVEMATESERTYRNMIELCNSEIEHGILSCGSTIEPCAKGIYKARLFGALFMVFAFARTGYSTTDIEEMMNLATGVALEPLIDKGGLYLDREEAKSFTMEYLKSAFKAITTAFKIGPMLPGIVEKEHLELAECLHEALAESIGIEYYTAEVRGRLEIAVQGNTAMAMNHAVRWIF